MGIVAGYLNLSGMVTHVLYALMCHLTIHLYVTGQLGIDLEALCGNASAVLTEGLLQSYAAFLLTWSVITTVLYVHQQ
jgi:hypothetical protein